MDRRLAGACEYALHSKIAAQIDYQQLPQKDLPAVAVLRLGTLLCKRCIPRTFAERCEDLFARVRRWLGQGERSLKVVMKRRLPSSTTVLQLNANLFTANDLFFHVVDALAVLTVAIALSVLQVRLGERWWGPISEVEQPVALIIVDLFWRWARRGRSRELGFAVFCIVAAVHWIAKLKAPGNE